MSTQKDDDAVLDTTWVVRDYEEKAMTLRDALRGLGPGSVGALLGLRQSDG